MRDAHDKKTAEMTFGRSASRTTSAQRQAAYAQRQRAAGRRQHSFWLTDIEAKHVAELLKVLRGDDLDI